MTTKQNSLVYKERGGVMERMNNNEETVKKWAECIMLKFDHSKTDEYKKLEVMNCMMLCFKEMLVGD